MQVAIHGLGKSFGSTEVLSGIELQVHEGEFCALLGPSGSGKTTLLRIIAGLEFADRGQVLFDGVDVAERQARDRQVGFVFQHYALFRHMTVHDNVAFGLQIRPRALRPARAEIDRRVCELLELVQLAGFEGRYADQLSGGQRQRVALARALAIQPRVLLLDEPFGALDARVRREMRSWLRQLQRQLGLTTVLVTHDQDEALELADRVAVMEQGRILQYDAPQQVYDRPATPHVYDFLGGANRIAARVSGGQVWVGEHCIGPLAAADDDAVTLHVRGHDIDLLPAGSGGGLPATVLRSSWGGAAVLYVLQLADGSVIEAQVPRWSGPQQPLAEGAALQVRLLRYGVFGPLAGSHPGLTS